MSEAEKPEIAESSVGWVQFVGRWISCHLETLTFMFTVIAAVSGVLAFVVAVFAWRYPNEPPPIKMDENFIYDNNSPIGRVSEFRIDFVLMGQIALRIDAARMLNTGEVIGFHDLHCVIIFSEGETSTVVRGKEVFAYDHIDCRIIGR